MTKHLLINYVYNYLLILKTKTLKKILFLNRCLLLSKFLKRIIFKKNYFFQINFYYYIIFFLKSCGVLYKKISYNKHQVCSGIYKNKNPFYESFFIAKSNEFGVVTYKENYLLWCTQYKIKKEYTFYITHVEEKSNLTNPGALKGNLNSNSIFKTDRNVKKIFFKKKNFLHSYVYTFFLKFFEYFLKKKVFLSFKKVNFLLFKFKKNKLMVFLKKKLGKNLFFIKDKSFLQGMVKILWLTFFFKDSTFFTNWFCQKFQILSLRDHKKFLRVLKLVLLRYYNFFFKNTNVLGFFFDVRGKLGVSGNAKKRHLSIFSGLYSSTNKSLKINFLQSNVKTTTGLLGVTFCLFF